MRIILLLLIVIISKGIASPTIYGPTGLIEMPTAESIAYKQVNLAVDYSLTNNDPNNALNSNAKDPKNHFFYKFNLGSFENWELGVLGGSFLDEGVFVNMKYFNVQSGRKSVINRGRN